MSSPAQTTDELLDNDELVSDLEAVISAHVADGKRYFRARDLTDDFPHTTNRIGKLLPRLADQSTTLTLERWSTGSDATLWYITPRNA